MPLSLGRTVGPYIFVAVSWALSCISPGQICAQAQSQAQPSPASTEAQTARANELFATAKQQQAAGHLAAACASFEESYAMSPRGGTLINLALCHRQLGELVVARQELLKARAVAERDGRADRVAIANEHLGTLERELSWVDVAAPAELGTSTANVSIDGRLISRDAHDGNPLSIALMPGEHNIRVEADGFDPVELQITLLAGARTRVPREPLRRRIIEAPLVPTPAPSAAEPVAAPNQATAPTPPAAPRDARDDYSGWRTASLALAIAGIVGGLSAGAWALERKSVVRQHCDADTNVCRDDAGADAAALGSTLALVSTVTCSVGLAGLGVWLFLPGGVFIDNAHAAGSSAGLTWQGKF